MVFLRKIKSREGKGDGYASAHCKSPGFSCEKSWDIKGLSVALACV